MLLGSGRVRVRVRVRYVRGGRGERKGGGVSGGSRRRRMVEGGGGGGGGGSKRGSSRRSSNSSSSSRSSSSSGRNSTTFLLLSPSLTSGRTCNRGVDFAAIVFKVMTLPGGEWSAITAAQRSSMLAPVAVRKAQRRMRMIPNPHPTCATAQGTARTLLPKTLLMRINVALVIVPVRGEASVSLLSTTASWGSDALTSSSSRREGLNKWWWWSSVVVLPQLME